MKLEEQVTSLELSKKLKELGVKQESLWSWVKDLRIDGTISAKVDFGLECKIYYDTFNKENYSAFTVAELDKEIKDYVIQNNDETLLPNWIQNIKALSIYEALILDANDKSELLIYLIENNLK